jgi:ABC-type amino acid transport system permease subunit
MNQNPKRVDGKAVVLVAVVAALVASVLLPAVNAGFALVSGTWEKTEPDMVRVLLAAALGVLTASIAGIGVAWLLWRGRRRRRGIR